MGAGHDFEDNFDKYLYVAITSTSLRNYTPRKLHFQIGISSLRVHKVDITTDKTKVTRLCLSQSAT